MIFIKSNTAPLSKEQWMAGNHTLNTKQIINRKPKHPHYYLLLYKRREVIACVCCDIFDLIFDILQINIPIVYVYVNFPQEAYLILLHNAQNSEGLIPTKKTFDEKMCYH
jgi:hypothetical protein